MILKDRWVLRLKFLAIGLALIFLGFLLVSVSQTPETKEKKTEEKIAEGTVNSAEINATLNTGDEFSLSYSGGSLNSDPNEMDVVIYDPVGESTTIPYVSEKKEGIIANQTGLHRMQLLGLFIDPERPFILTVMRIHRRTDIRYPNSNMFPVGASTIVAGIGIFVWGATSSRGKPSRIRRHGRQH